MRLQRRIYEAGVRLHPAAFRREFGREMCGDFDEALQGYKTGASWGVGTLYADLFVSVVRQWTARASQDEAEPRRVQGASLMGGHYRVVAQGGLTLFDWLCGSALSLFLFGVLGAVLHL